MPYKKRLGDILVEAGLITRNDLEKAIIEQKKTGKRLEKILVELGIVKEKDLAEVLEFQMGIPRFDFNRNCIDPEAVRMVPEHIARTYCLIPVKRQGDKLIVAMTDPLNETAINDIKMAVGLDVDPVIAGEAEINKQIELHHFKGPIDGINFLSLETSAIEESNAVEKIESIADTPAVRLVNSLISRGINESASDIHIEPEEEEVIIRFRIDGFLREIMRYPLQLHNAVVARIKILAGMNITRKRLPQDGRIKMRVKDTGVDLRVSTLPTIYGERVAVRILDQSKFLFDINELGFYPDSLESLKNLIQSPYGMILVTGPTGSGKTTTLYSFLRLLNTPEKNIITLEDPVEAVIQGVNQVQINPGTGLTFAKGLRAILRQDPNIIMVGEIRDAETADIAVRAALTGHLVLSTLHTNNSAGAVTRLIDMGVEPFLVASSVVCVIAQRLVRKICKYCKHSYEPSEREKFLLNSMPDTTTLYKGRGCPYCGETGFKGRTAVYEIMKVTQKHRELINAKVSADHLMSASKKQGMETLRENALKKVIQGITSFDEAVRVAFTEESG